MEIIETPLFTKRVLQEMREEEYRELQLALVDNPALGPGIGYGGLRKLRWKAEGRGKRGGYRIIYYWATESGIILLLFMYPKNEQEELTAAQKRVLQRIVEAEFG